MVNFIGKGLHLLFLLGREYIFVCDRYARYRCFLLFQTAFTADKCGNISWYCLCCVEFSILSTNTRGSRKGGVKQKWLHNAWACPDNAGLGLCLSFNWLHNSPQLTNIAFVNKVVLWFLGCIGKTEVKL